MSIKDDGITPAVLLQHMQGMEQRLTGKIDGVEQKLTILEAKVDRNHEEARRNHAIVMTGLDNIDSRLDDIEVVQVPKLKKAVGMR